MRFITYVVLGRQDSGGIRFYLGNKLRKHDLGIFTFGTPTDHSTLAIPPLVETMVIRIEMDT